MPLRVSRGKAIDQGNPPTHESGDRPFDQSTSGRGGRFVENPILSSSRNRRMACNGDARGESVMRYNVVFGTAIVTALLSGAATAIEQQESLDQITVTAARTALPIESAGSAITIIDRAEIERRHAGGR